MSRRKKFPPGKSSRGGSNEKVSHPLPNKRPRALGSVGYCPPPPPGGGGGGGLPQGQQGKRIFFVTTHLLVLVSKWDREQGRNEGILGIDVLSALGDTRTNPTRP